MSKYQRKDMVMRYALSPGSLKRQNLQHHQSGYSWKNYISPDVNSIYCKIKKYQHYQSSFVDDYCHPQMIEHTNRNQVNTFQTKYPPIQKQNNFHPTQYPKNPQHTSQKMKNTNSTSASTTSTLFSTRNTNNKMFKSCIYESQIRNTDKNIYKLQLTQNNDDDTRMSGRQMIKRQVDEDTYKQWQNNSTRRSNIKSSNRHKLTTQTGVSTDHISWYHLQLKQDQRLYLLHHFTQHVQDKHNQTL